MAELQINCEDLGGLKDKVVIVTGGSSGIGLGTVTFLLFLGATVVNADIAPLADPSVLPAGAPYTFVQGSVTEWKDLVALFKQTKQQHGRIDHVFCNAGVGPKADYFSLEIDENGDLKEPSQALYDVSQRGVINTAALAIHYMKEQETGGSIVINASVFSYQRGRPVDYVTAKHAVLGFARALIPALDAAGLASKIRVNSVCPSWTNTSVIPGLQQIFDAIGVEVQPAEAVAKAAAVLMADEKRNGQTIHVQQNKFKEIDEAGLLPMADVFRGKDYPAEDETYKRALEWVTAQHAKSA